MSNEPLASSSTLNGFSNFAPYVEIFLNLPLPKKHWVATAYQKLKVVNKKCEWCYFQKYPKINIKQNKPIKKQIKTKK